MTVPLWGEFTIDWWISLKETVINTSMSWCHHANQTPNLVTPGNRGTYCFWSVSAAATISAAAAILPTLFNFPGKPLKLISSNRMVNLWMWENILVRISVTLDQGQQATEAEQILPCPHDKMRIAHFIAKKLSRYIPLVMVSTWLNFVKFFTIFFRKILNAFVGMGLQGQIWNLLYLSQKWFDCHETKSKHNDWTLGLKWDNWVWTLSWHWPWP